MRTNKLMLLLILIAFVWISCSSTTGEKLTEEQMIAYRTRPAVVLVYSGMILKVALKSGQQFEIPSYGSGSGFFINPEGCLVTSGHVVDFYEKYMKNKNGYAQEVLPNFIMNKIIREFRKASGREPSQEEVNNRYMEFMETQQPTIVSHEPINWVFLSNAESLRFEVKKFSPSIPDGGKNIAVLKIERDNCPVIMLGDSSKLVLQQKVFTIGFPAVVDPQRFSLPDKKNMLTSSITRGAISALKRDYKGMPVIQHDSAALPGNAGGPTVDSEGDAIGVHSYATREYDGFKFCVPINAAKEFIRDAGVEFNKNSEFTKVFNQLMDSVWDGNWFDAQTQVSTALDYMKNEPVLEELQRMILKKISEMGFFEKIWRQNKIIVIIAVILIILILLVLKISFSPSAAVEAEPQKGAPVPDKTKPAEEEGAVLEGEIAGSLTVLVKGEEVGTFNITTTPMIVGRDPSSATVVIKNEIVSKNHLKVLPKGDQFFIVDLNSTNGTYVNGQKITETLVKPEDMVQLGKRGNVKLVFKK